MVAMASRYEHKADVVGITKPIIRHVIAAFYEKVKRDATLGPVFADIVGDDWDAHVEKVCSFWFYVTRLDLGYTARNFTPAHTRHRSIHLSLLPQWLRLFRETAGESLTKEMADVLVDIAERMAVSIEMSLVKRDGSPDAPDQADGLTGPS